MTGLTLHQNPMGSGMLQESLPKDKFFGELLAQFENCSNIEPFANFRKIAWDSFVQRGLPDKKNKAFQYLPLHALYSERLFSPLKTANIDKDRLAAHIAEESRHSCLLFVNGALRLDLSDLTALPKQVVVQPLEKGFFSYKSFLQQRIDKLLRDEEDPFALLNAALQTQGCFFYVPPKTILAHPVQCLHLISGAQGQLPCFNLRAHLVIGAHSQMELTSKTVLLEENQRFFGTSCWDAAVEEGAKLTCLPIFTEEKESWHFDYFHATLKKDSQLKTVSCSEGGRSIRQNYHVTLAGENSAADLQGLWLLDGHRQCHTHVFIDHLAPHTRSMQCFKGVLNEAGQSSFDGKIYVQRDAQKTEAYQLNHNLLIGEGAIANSCPNLEIFADDVKASHGSTVAHLDAAQLFYMQARGIDPAKAKSLLVAGFCRTVLDQIPIVSVRKEIEKLLQAYEGKI